MPLALTVLVGLVAIGAAISSTAEPAHLPGVILLLLLAAGWIEQRKRLIAARRALSLTLDTIDQGVMVIDAHGRVPVINRRAAAWFALPHGSAHPMPAARAEAALPPAQSVPVQPMPVQPVPVQTVPAQIVPGQTLSGQTVPGQTVSGEVHTDGRIIETATHPMPGGGYVRTFTDVTGQRAAEARLHHMAYHDPLTGLANRRSLTDRIAERANRGGGEPFGLLWFDLDGFKTVNDTLGHEAGDRLLREAARRLRPLAENDALVARTGGDEFALLGPSGAGPGTMRDLADALLASLGEPFDIDGTQFRLSASMGLAQYPEDGAAAPVLLKHAMTAMYQAKARGRGLAVRFDPEMDRALRERGQIERDLRRALRDRELEVWFQPRFDANASRISGFEALARWRHPEHGFISPARFIPVAEQAGLIADLGMVVLEEACVFAASLPEGRIAVNLSPVQFLSNNMADLIGAVLTRNNLTPDRLELEITEGVLIADEAQALSTLKKLHDRHLHLALDDFGTGYASLSYLRRFPFDRIKIDQSFVQAQEHDSTTRAITESVMTMARRLRLEVTAEGVETERQLELLLSQGCPEVQGYLLGRPMPASDARAFHANHKTRTARAQPETLNLTTA